MVATPSSQLAGGKLHGNGSKNLSSSRSLDPLSAAQATKAKQPGLQDMKALQLEQEFKVRHIGVMGVLAWIM